MDKVDYPCLLPFSYGHKVLACSKACVSIIVRVLFSYMHRSNRNFLAAVVVDGAGRRANRQRTWTLQLPPTAVPAG